MKDGLIGASVGLILGVSATLGFVGESKLEHKPPEVPAVVCNVGFTYDPQRVGDAVVIACAGNGWRVYLNPDGSFSHAQAESGGPYEKNPAKVPGWLR